MPTVTFGQIQQEVRGILNDTQVTGGEVFTAQYFVNNPNAFGKPYRSMWSRMIGGSKKVQKVAYVVLPGQTTLLVPDTFGIEDFNEPEMIEERPAVTPISITSTDTSTPIIAFSPSHGLGPPGNIAPGQISNVFNTMAPWGNWFIRVIDNDHFSLNGSQSDGIAGTGGSFYSQSSQPFSTVYPIDLTFEGLDGQPSQVLGNYLWIDNALQFRGASSPIQLRLTYYSSGQPPTNPNAVIAVDDCVDFLAVATAAECANSQNWTSKYELLRNQAYGDPSHPEEPSLLDLFYSKQVLALQRGPQRRQLAFREKRSRWGTYLLG